MMKFGPVFAVPTYTILVRGEHGCSMMGNPSFVDNQIDCYLSSRPQGVVDVMYSEFCGHCGGQGMVAGGRPGRMLRGGKRASRTPRQCPVCKGQPEVFPSTLIRTAVSHMNIAYEVL